MRKINNGFTLAETLVTMGILAVIALLTMQAMQHLTPNREQVMLKKAYYLIGRNVTELINDDEFYPDTGAKTENGFSNTRRITYRSINYGNDDPAANDAHQKFCLLFASKMNIHDTADICNAGLEVANAFEKGAEPTGHFRTADGAVWVMPIGNFSRGKAESVDSNMSIYIDVNGDKGPNCFSQTADDNNTDLRGLTCDSASAAPDRFEVKVDRWGKLTVPDILSRLYLRRTETTKAYKEYEDLIKEELKKSESESDSEAEGNNQ